MAELGLSLVVIYDSLPAAIDVWFVHLVNLAKVSQINQILHDVVG